MKEFIFILDLEGNHLYRPKGTNFGVLNTKELQEGLLGRQVILIIHRYVIATFARICKTFLHGGTLCLACQRLKNSKLNITIFIFNVEFIIYEDRFIHLKS